MELLGLCPIASFLFSEDNTVIISDVTIPGLFKTNEKAEEILASFKEKYPQFLPYHIIHSYTNIGELYDILFVEVDEESEVWNYSKEEIGNGDITAYCYNKDMPDCSEIGGIGVKNCNGILARTY